MTAARAAGLLVAFSLMTAMAEPPAGPASGSPPADAVRSMAKESMLADPAASPKLAAPESVLPEEAVQAAAPPERALTEAPHAIEPAAAGLANKAAGPLSRAQTQALLDGDPLRSLPADIRGAQQPPLPGDPSLKKSPPADVQSLRQALQAAAAQPTNPALAEQMRQAGEARLAADRAAHRKVRAPASPEQAGRSVSKTNPNLARKTPLGPLTASPAAQTPSCREADVQRLKEAIENASTAGEADGFRLSLAAAYVGAGQWGDARAIYEELAQNAEQACIREAATRNLAILARGKPRSGPAGTSDAALRAAGRVQQ